MGQLMTPICDRCGQRGAEGQTFALVKFITRQGHVRVMDLCYRCEAQMEKWTEDHEEKDERVNGHGTD